MELTKDIAVSARLTAVIRTVLSDLGDTDPFLEGFLQESDPVRSLKLWFGVRLSTIEGMSRELIVSLINRDIELIDRVLNQIINDILHHRRFQQLEATWRGLFYLLRHTPDSGNVKIRVLDVTWEELSRDSERAIEFDQTQLFKKVYEEEFGMPGGCPFGLLLADYDVSHRVTVDHPTDDIAVLKSLASVAAAAFAPVVVGARPELFGLESFDDLSRGIDLEKTFAQLEYIPWRSFCSSEDARFVGVTLPRVLVRRPYGNYTARNDRFPFREEVRGRSYRNYLWGNAVYAFGAVAARSFSTTSWFEDALGTTRDMIGGGLVTGLPGDSFDTDSAGVAPKFETDVCITDELDRRFSTRGFIPLCHCKYTQFAAFYNAPSVNRPKEYVNRFAQANSVLSARLDLMLCVSRFAHYVKVMVRDQIGQFTSPRELSLYLNQWIQGYVIADPTPSPSSRGQYPLREASIQIRENPTNPDCYFCTIHMKVHLDPKEADAAVKFKTELPSFQNRPLGGLTRAV